MGKLTLLTFQVIIGKMPKSRQTLQIKSFQYSKEGKNRILPSTTKNMLLLGVQSKACPE